MALNLDPTADPTAHIWGGPGLQPPRWTGRRSGRSTLRGVVAGPESPDDPDDDDDPEEDEPKDDDGGHTTPEGGDSPLGPMFDDPTGTHAGGGGTGGGVGGEGGGVGGDGGVVPADPTAAR